MSCYDLDVISSIIKIEGKIVNETPLRIGTGKTPDFTTKSDDPIMKINDKPIIPGSSLKGSLRSLAEAYLKTQNDPKYPVLDISDHKTPSCGKDYVCVSCLLFGFHDVSSRIYILDAIAEKYSISERTMVTINRVFGAQQPGNLYTLDFVDPSSVFSFTMYVYNLNFIEDENEEWKKKGVEVIRFLLKNMKEGFFVGGRKSTGSGLVKLIDATLTLYKIPNMTPRVLKLDEVINSWKTTPS